MNAPSVSVCFPAYNEDASIAQVIRDAQVQLSTSGLDYEILVCDDGSSDRTAEIIEQIAAGLPQLRVLRHASNQGIRQTFEDLYHASRKDFVFLNATDGQWRNQVLFDLLPLAGAYDIVLTRRAKKPYSWTRRVVSATFNFIPRVLFGVATHDAGSVKLMRREIIQRFSIVSRSPFNEAERLIKASRAGCRITCVPVEVRPRPKGQGRGGCPCVGLLWEAIKDVWRVWLDVKWRGAAKQDTASPRGPWPWPGRVGAR